MVSVLHGPGNSPFFWMNWSRKKVPVPVLEKSTGPGTGKNSGYRHTLLDMIMTWLMYEKFANLDRFILHCLILSQSKGHIILFLNFMNTKCGHPRTHWTCFAKKKWSSQWLLRCAETRWSELWWCASSSAWWRWSGKQDGVHEGEAIACASDSNWFYLWLWYYMIFPQSVGHLRVSRGLLHNWVTES